jgi:hypothetical protein
MSTVDVITVPDFTGPAAARFELRTLLFLGSWMLHRGASQSWPVHLACIGAPPASVRRLAAAAGASVTVHESMPAPFPGTSNKLRGLEIKPTADRFLLVDTDAMFLRDLEPVAQAVGNGIGVGPVTQNHYTESQWQRIYACVGVPYPGPVGTCWRARWDLNEHRRLSPEIMDRCLRMPPYYNGGVIMAAWSLDLGSMWREHLRLILRDLTDARVGVGDQWVRYSDQHGLATTVEALRLAGVGVQTLPLPYQVRPPLLVAGVMAWPEVALFHYVNVFRSLADSVDDTACLLYGHRLRAVRRMLAAVVGLRAVLSPVYRRVEPKRLRAYGPFFQQVHRIFKEHSL